MLKKILIGLGVVIVLFVIIVATRPSVVHIERTATMTAPPAAVFPMVNDFHSWAQWSPWDKRDPAMKKDYEGGPGEGAKYHWAGNDQVGEGRMTITESKPNEKIAIKLDFIKPMEGSNTSLFTFTPAGAGTKVTWSGDFNMNFMGKAFGLFMNMDDMVGKDFESGLGQLNAVSAAEAKKQADEAAAKAAAAAAVQPSPTPAPAAPPAPPAKRKK
jgi:uncharacterized protein YndB with AHSA1/START domain